MSANVGYATVSIIPSAKGFGPALNKSISPSLAAAGTAGGAKAGKGFKGSFLGSMKGLGAAVAGSAALLKAGQILSDSVNLASDLAETGTALKQVFGDGTKAVEAFGATGAKALGMSKLEALQAAQTFGVYGKAAGLSGKENAKFSTSLAALGTDLASFYNSSPEEAIQAIGSGLRGEAEPLRRFGILLDDATLRAQALKMGLVKSTKEALTPQNKVLAAQAVIMKQSKVAQGDFARTSGGLANQQRILAAQWKDAKTNLGASLLPTVLSAVKGFNGLFDSAEKIGPALKSAFSSGGGGGGLGASLAATFGAVKSFGASLLPVIREVGTSIMGTLGPGFRSVSETLQSTFLPAFRAILPILQPIAAFIIRTIGSAVVGALKGAFAVINGVLKIVAGLFRVIASAVKGDWSGMWSGVKTIASGVMQAVKGLIQVWWNVGILGAFKKIGLSVLGSFKGLWTGLKGAASSGMASVRSWISGGLSAIGGFFVRTASSIKSSFSGAISSLVATARSLPGRALSALGNVGSKLVSAGGDLIRGFIRGITSAAGGIVSAIRDSITDKIPKFVRDKLGIHSPSRVFMEIGGYTAEGMALGISKKAGLVTKAADGLAYAPSPSAARATASAGSGGGATENVFHLYDADGHLMGTMRGAARTEITQAARGITRGTR